MSEEDQFVAEILVLLLENTKLVLLWPDDEA